MGATDLSAEAIQRGLGTHVIGQRVLYLAEAPSTMAVARREAQAGAPNGTVVVADAQTAGRGRFARVWVSPPGVNLYLSVLLRPRLHQLRQTNMAATLAVVRAIHATTGLQPTVKWPNDVHLDGRKTCGILMDSKIEDGGVRYAIVGIGLNVNFDPTPYPEIAATATSLMQQAGRPLPRLLVLQTLLRELDGLYADLGRGESVWQEWRGLLETLGRRVQVRWGDQVEEGLAAEVDQEGDLVLERPDGTRVVLPAGEVTLQA